MTAHKIDLVMDFQYGSTGKGLLAGYLAKRGAYDTVVCAFAANAGHTYVDKERNISMVTQQLPTAISSPTVKSVLLGPGSLIHLPTLFAEMDRYKDMIANKQIVIHPNAAIITDAHAEMEKNWGQSKMGSTTKGVGAAMVQRIMRGSNNMSLNIAGSAPHFAELDKRNIFINANLYRAVMEESQEMLIEGAQGFGLSIYHGQYPYCTSRDVTPAQIMADCAIPFRAGRYVQVFGTLRTFPIRVSNRDGYSGPCHEDQREMSWGEFGIAPELTTVTKLPRRIFTFSQEQLTEAVHMCGGYWKTKLFLNFCNYFTPNLGGRTALEKLVRDIETARPFMWNMPDVEFFGYGPDDSEVRTRVDFEQYNTPDIPF